MPETCWQWATGRPRNTAVLALVGAWALAAVRYQNSRVYYQDAAMGSAGNLTCHGSRSAVVPIDDHDMGGATAAALVTDRVVVT
jgi:hypothetical protein